MFFIFYLIYFKKIQNKIISKLLASQKYSKDHIISVIYLKSFINKTMKIKIIKKIINKKFSMLTVLK